MGNVPSQLLGTIVIFVSNGKILMGKRKNSYGSGFYGMPGGRVNNSEKIIDCARRELTEETGLTAENLKYIGVVRDAHENYSFVHFAFVCEDYQGTPKLTEPDKCEGWEWFEQNKVPENVLPGHKAAIDMFLSPESEAFRDISSV